MTHAWSEQILKAYGLSVGDRIGRGMEAEVFRLDEARVLKLYTDSATLPELEQLKLFYDRLQPADLPFKLPKILSIRLEEDCITSEEIWLEGTPLTERLHEGSTAELDSLLQSYLDVILAVQSISVDPPFPRFKLFDPEQISAEEHGDWHRFLMRFLDATLAKVAPFLEKNVSDFQAKVGLLKNLLDRPYRGDIRLIHGDICPANVLINPAGVATALLDFGLFTMFGDPAFDWATGWLFFDMYNELRLSVRERLLAMLLNRIGEYSRGRLYRYALLYSILSVNTYSSTCSDGHAAWCVANLNRADYWQHLD